MRPLANDRAQFGRRALTLAVAAALGGGLSAPVQAQLFPAEIDLSALDGTNGFALNRRPRDPAQSAGDNLGFSVSGAGDVNGDGIDDLIIGASRAGQNGGDSGTSYVVFGSASGLPNPFNLSANSNGQHFSLRGEFPGDRLGTSVSAAGDVNGDGIDDLIVGAFGADPNGNSAAGRSYVVFGSTNAWPTIFDLSTLNGLNGFVLNGESQFDASGRSVSAAGDINGDGIDDLIVGAWLAGPNGNVNAGRSYVVFGSTNAWPTIFDLSTLNGLNGFVLNGEAAADQSGISVSAAGDVNGDGIDDLIVGAYGANPNGNSDAGRSYVVFGSATGRPNPFNLSTLDGSNGFVLNGETAGDKSGISVSAAGDVNGDGIDDLVVGAHRADPNGDSSGRSYVVFGSATGFPAAIDLDSLDGTNGFALNGEAASDRSGGSVRGAGDVNGDGIDDVVVGAYRASPNGNSYSGRSYVVFGSEAGFAAAIDLSSLDGTNGFALNGEAAVDLSGFSVSGAGDVNGDGIDDLIVGAPFADPNGSLEAGRAYVVYGRAARDLVVTKTNGAAFVEPGLPTTWFIEVRNLTGGVAIKGATLIDNLPPTVDAATATWSCAGFDGAACPNAAGSGNLNEIIDLPAMGRLVYELTATVLATEGELVVNTATITMPAGLTDVNPANNSATDADPVGLFADGFETE